jgi:uncharacterized protein
VKIGVISDTHGLLRPEALRALDGVQHIIHAGDIGGPELLRELESIAPVAAVRGNNDKGAWANPLPEVLDLEFEGVAIRVIHDVKELALHPEAARRSRTTRGPQGDIEAGRTQLSGARPRVVISGHSHKPVIDERDGVLFVNPGSAGPRRFSLPVAVAWLVVAGGTARAQIRPIL